MGLLYEDGDFDATLRLFSVRSNPTNIGVHNRGTNTDGTNIAGVNPRINPITGASFDTHEGAYDHTGHIKVKGDGGYLTMNWSFKNFDITSITSALDGEFYNPVDGGGIFPASAFSGSFGVADNKKLEEVANDVVTYISFNM